MSFIRQIKRNGRIYYAEVENKRDGVKVRQKVIRYIPVSKEQKKTLIKGRFNKLSLDSHRVSGSIISLDWLSKQLGLYELLGEDAHPILTLVFCHCHDYQSASKTEGWFEKTDLNRIFGIEKMPDSRLRKAIDSLGKKNLLAIQKSIFEKLIAFSGQEESSVIYDTTNTFFTGKCCKLAKMGLDKEGVRGRKLIQIGLAITKRHGFPIFHQIHPGNIHDSKMFSEAIANIKIFGLKKGIIVYDRGIGSIDSTLALSDEHWKVVAGMPIHRGIKHIISKMDFSSIKNYRNRIEQGTTTFYVRVKKYSFGKVKGKLLILLNPFKREVKREERIDKIIHTQQKKQHQEPTNPKLRKFLNKNGKINTHAVKRSEKFDGLSCIFTNAKLSSKDIVKTYFERGLIERSFQSLKGVLALRPIRFWLEENVESHLFICYLAYALLTTFRFQIEKARGKRGFKELKYLSAEDAFDELANVYRVYFHDKGSISPENPQPSMLISLSKRQYQVLKAISSTLVLK